MRATFSVILSQTISKKNKENVHLFLDLEETDVIYVFNKVYNSQEDYNG